MDKWPLLRDAMEKMLSEVRVRSEREDLLMWMPESLDIDTWNEGQQLGPFGMYEKFIEEVRKSGVKTETGIFQAEMKVCICNDGPVTLMIDSKE